MGTPTIFADSPRLRRNMLVSSADLGYDRVSQTQQAGFWAVNYPPGGIAWDPSVRYGAPDGSETAYKLDDVDPYGSGLTGHFFFQNLTERAVEGQAYAGSAHFKAAERRYVALLCDFNDWTDIRTYTFGAMFDLLVGRVVRVWNEEWWNGWPEPEPRAATSEVAPSIEPLGGGWYRCGVTFRAPRADQARFAFSPWDGVTGTVEDPSFSFPTDGTSGFYFWGPQYEPGDAITAYIPTNRAPVSVPASSPGIVETPGHAERAAARLLEQYREGARLPALVRALGARYQVLEGLAWDVRAGRLIDAAKGAQLDQIGRIVGQPRGKRSDPTYRIWLRARTRLNRSYGCAEDLIDVFRAVTQGQTTVKVEEQYPATVVVKVGSTSVVDPLELNAVLQEGKAGGVRGILESATSADETSFACAPNGAGCGSTTNAAIGGTLATAF